MEQLLEAVISVRSDPRLYNENYLPSWESLETRTTRVSGCCEMAASSRGEEHPLLEDVTKHRSEDRDRVFVWLIRKA
jgi:hypothetical protein